RPVLLVLEDLESADEQSLQMLRFLARGRGGGALMTVAACRLPVLPGSAAAAWLSSIGREPSVDVVTLAGLTLEETSAMAAAMLGAPASAGVVAALHARIPAERARQSVTKAIKGAITRIGRQHGA